MNEPLILITVFVAMLLGAFAVFSMVLQRREIDRNISSARNRRNQIDTDDLLATGNEKLRYYIDVVRNEDPNSTRMRLVRAGFFSRATYVQFNILRFVIVAGVFVAIQFGLPNLIPTLSNAMLLVLSLCGAAASFIFCSYILEKMGNKKLIEYRKLFPDFMDLLLVCLDAGLSIDAAFDRVTREFLHTVPHFGMQLSIINLEIRAGRPLRDALFNFSDRIDVEEARTLAVLFRQSEELGTSVTKTLRTFAKEMRQLRIIKAEEKANALPIKMLFPMAFFMFPVSLIIVLVPIMMTLLQLLNQMQPGG